MFRMKYKILLVTVLSIVYDIFINLVRLFRPNRFRYHKNVKGQLVVIVGAGNDLGRILSKKFALLGANLILIDTDNLIMESIINEVSRLGVKAVSIICDMSRDGIYTIADKVCFFFIYF
jgi:FlaA1/EpsC-like NDP-sugar epimerase